MRNTETPVNTALFVIDLQRDFLEAAALMPIGQKEAARVVHLANCLLEHAEAAGWKQVLIKNEFRKDDWFGNLLRKNAAVEGSAGAEFDPRLRVPATAAAVPKAQANAFGNPILEPMLKEASVRRIVVAGVMTEACVRATANGAIKRGFDVTVVSDAVASSSGLLHRCGLKLMQNAGVLIQECSEILAATASSNDETLRRQILEEQGRSGR